MKLQSYEELKHSKYRFSLMLLLFLNVVISLFFLTPIKKSEMTLPIIYVAIFSSALLCLCLIRTKLKLPLLNPVSLILSALWAWHINYRFHQVFYFNGGFLIQHLMSRRVDNFTLRLMHQLYQEKEALSDLSMLDPLTGLYNRRRLKNQLDNILQNHACSHYVLLLDIDHFKTYNDNYGHTMGDQALARVSVAIRDAVRSRDVVTLYDGEEFLVLMTNVTVPLQ